MSKLAVVNLDDVGVPWTGPVFDYPMQLLVAIHIARGQRFQLLSTRPGVTGVVLSAKRVKVK